MRVRRGGCGNAHSSTIHNTSSAETHCDRIMVVVLHGCSECEVWILQNFICLYGQATTVIGCGLWNDFGFCLASQPHVVTCACCRLSGQFSKVESSTQGLRTNKRSQRLHIGAQRIVHHVWRTCDHNACLDARAPIWHLLQPNLRTSP